MVRLKVAEKAKNLRGLFPFLNRPYVADKIVEKIARIKSVKAAAKMLRLLDVGIDRREEIEAKLRVR